MKKSYFLVLVLALLGCDNSKTQSTESTASNRSKFQWDFSQERTFVYSFSQEVNAENQMIKAQPDSKTYMSGVGYLKVRVKEDSLADLSLVDIKMQMLNYDSGGNPGDTITQTIPPNVAQDMKPDGSFEDSNTNMVFKMIFPLPNADLEKGDSEALMMSMPFNAGGSKLFSKGQITLTHSGHQKIDGKDCTVFEGDLDISDLNIPEELKGDFGCSVIGKGTYYFDTENGYYVGANIQMVMDVLMDTEGQEDFGMYMKMTSENTYKIRLEKIEE